MRSLVSTLRSYLSFVNSYFFLIISCLVYQVYQIGLDSWTRKHLAQHGRTTQATVVGMVEDTGEDNWGYFLRLRFTTATGAVVWTRSQQAYDSLAYRVGQPVALRYDPRDPRVCLTEAELTSRKYLLNLVIILPFMLFFSRFFQRGP